jgi:tetratricopeptide (TPR) repeat protein
MRLPRHSSIRRMPMLGENDRFEEEARRALALNPNDPETLADVGHYLAFMGEFERGAELSRRAQQLNPGAARAHIFELKPGFSAHEELRKWNAAPDDFEHLMQGLGKAGLPA